MRKVLFLTVVLLGACGLGEGGFDHIFFFIGDGMGQAHEDLGSLYITGAPGRLNFQQFPYKYVVRTGSADNAITDSAASATAYATGVEVNNGVIAREIPGSGKDLQTILDLALKNGYYTGVITTSQVTHATPAAFTGHADNRNSAAQIGSEQVKSGTHFLFGGGSPGISEDLLIKNDYTVLENLDSSPDKAKTAFLWGETHIPYESDAVENAPTLKDMIQKALAISEDRAITKTFWIIEAARIDHGAHANDVEKTLFEIIGLARSVSYVESWLKRNGSGIILVTADHETGGLSVPQIGTAGNIPSVSWSTGGHTAADINLYSTSSLNITSLIENEELFDVLQSLTK